MKQIVPASLFLLISACAAPEPEPAPVRTPDRVPSSGQVGETEMLAEPASPVEICDGTGDGIGGTGCPVD